MAMSVLSATLLLLLLAAIAIATSLERYNHNKAAATKKYFFYIYDSPAWHNISVASFSKRDSLEIMDTSLNYGAGPLINISAGQFHTDQYQLYALIYNRALRDIRRTLDPEKATTFFVPYDFASDSAYYKYCAKSVGRCYDFRKCPLAPVVEELLKESKYYRRNKGRDHLLLVGMNYAMDHYLGKPKCKSLLANTCYNCTKLAIDDYSFLHAGSEGLVDKGDYWHATPFPSDFHWTREVREPFPWQNLDRPILVSYIGSTRSYYNPARRIRGSLVHFCEQHPPSVCSHSSYGKNGTRDSFKVEGHNPLSLSARSVFCLQPIGDLMTRKGLFDSLLQGCIPVTFDSLTAVAMYTWHWDEEFWNKVTVQYSFHPVAHRYFDPIAALETLYKNNYTEVLKKQQLIREKVFELHYALEGREELDGKVLAAKSRPWLNLSDPSESKTDVSASLSTGKGSWPSYVTGGDDLGLPMRDAFEIIIDHVLGWHSGTESEYRNASIPECWGGELNKERTKCVKVVKPDKGKT